MAYGVSLIGKKSGSGVSPLDVPQGRRDGGGHRRPVRATVKPMRKAKSTKARRTETVRDAIYRYTVHFEPAEEGGYVVKVPALNGIATQGETLEEARAMAEDLIRGYLQSLRKHGEPIPVERDEALTTRIAVSLARA